MLSIEVRFGEALRTVLRRRYGRLPSAAFVTNQFNRRITGVNGVSGETIRRWIRGMSMPRYDHLEVLGEWLEMDFQELFGLESRSKTVSQTPSLVTRFSALHPELQERLIAVAEASSVFFRSAVGESRDATY